MSIVDDIRSEAARLGFGLCGVTRPEPPPRYHAYTKWLAAGRQAGMSYLETDRARQVRANPASALPGARSVLALGIRYPDPRAFPDLPAHEPLGRVAAYAWGDDYHDVLPPRLQRLAARLEEILAKPITSRAYTDTGPLLERELAQQAGLGWAGKNTCLIHPKQGSYFLLAELLLDAELPVDRPITTDLCGSCRRCIEACPTGCIEEDRSIDSNRCISYLTIENKGAISTELRPQIGDWVFGCDVCQQVCPWNLRFSDIEAGFEFTPRPDVPRPILRSELGLDPQEFNRKFHRSPVRRAKRRGYLRNVAVALGNQPDPASVPVLSDVLLAELEPLVRGHAAWALGQIGDRSARRTLDKARREEDDPSVRVEIERALAITASTPAWPHPSQ